MRSDERRRLCIKERCLLSWPVKIIWWTIIKTKVKETIIFILARYRRTIFLRLIFKLCQGFIKGFQNYSYNQNLNGELGLIRSLSMNSTVKTVFDVGAHYGDWAQIAKSYFPDANIFCFEIIQETFTKLKAKIGYDSRVTIN